MHDVGARSTACAVELLRHAKVQPLPRQVCIPHAATEHPARARPVPSRQVALYNGSPRLRFIPLPVCSPLPSPAPATGPSPSLLAPSLLTDVELELVEVLVAADVVGQAAGHDLGGEGHDAGGGVERVAGVQAVGRRRGAAVAAIAAGEQEGVPPAAVRTWNRWEEARGNGVSCWRGRIHAWHVAHRCRGLPSLGADSVESVGGPMCRRDLLAPHSPVVSV